MIAARLGLVRHGPTAWNRAGRIQGRSDIPLDAEACAETAALRLPSPWTAARLVSSPLLRARQTALLLAGREPEIEPRLTEMDWGAWEGLRGVDLRADAASGYRDIESWGWGFRPPEGESVDALRARLTPWLAEIAAAGGDWLAVCHIGVMRVILALAHGWPFEGPPPFQVKRRRLYPLRLAEDGRPSPAGEAIRLEPRETP